jgi:hypothetical protein
MKPDPTRNDRQRRWYWAHKEHKNALTHAFYWARVALGLCPTCGLDPRPGKRLCEICQTRRNKR